MEKRKLLLATLELQPAFYRPDVDTRTRPFPV